MGILRQLRILNKVGPLFEDRCCQIGIGLCRLRYALLIGFRSVLLSTRDLPIALAVVVRNCKLQNANLRRRGEPVLRSVSDVGGLALKGQWRLHTGTASESNCCDCFESLL